MPGSLVGTAANVTDVTQVDQLLHGEETYVCGDAGYTGMDKRAEHQDRQMIWSIATRPSRYKKHGEKSLIARVYRKIEFTKGQLRAKVEHPFRVIKRQFGYTKVRFRGLAKNTAQQGHSVCLVEPLGGAKTAAGDRRGAPVMRKAP
ncbi:ISPssy, transposase [Pseudomonas savastanoi]|uniref:ISPssy, transposase n=1 Tax=Pseudomonas savastanoi TaxID=29438 RepID=A0A3M6A8J2_PSESS|nr:ISPssy, transposase [Pseudomonas syringae pv. cunninghamiae]RMV15580.1 ISPssy, transposase [Pseudomonas savastanoi]